MEALSSNTSTIKKSWALVPHTCNPSYSGGRDREDFGSKPAWAKKIKKTHHKKGLAEWLKVKAEFKPQCCKISKKDSYAKAIQRTHQHLRTAGEVVPLRGQPGEMLKEWSEQGARTKEMIQTWGSFKCCQGSNTCG
jgi:CRISPR/Cas system CSM-associated protein Csm4 (group 5 of RAMP superfamily)